MGERGGGIGRFVVGTLVVLALLAALCCGGGWWLWTKASPQLAEAFDVERGSGRAVAEERAVGAFERVRVDGVIDVHVRVGAERSVVVHADDNLLASVTTNVVGGELRIATLGSFDPATRMTVDVVTPTLSALHGVGVGEVVADGVVADRFEVRVGGVGDVTVTGTADVLDVRTSGVGDANLLGLDAREAHVDASGVGSVDVRVRELLDASVRGVGSVRYAGNPPTVRQTVDGVGSVTPLEGR